VSLTLEVIDKGATSETHPVPLLFVHGAWHAAWCWDEYFLNFFADKGYRALALSVRGHGASPPPKSPRTTPIADFVDDVASIADSLPTRPVVIGHSQGGFVVQKYLELHHAPAGVLIGSVPPRGSAGFVLRWLRRHPWHAAKAFLTGKSVHCFNTEALAREWFFSAHTPTPDVVRHAARLEEEHSARIAVDSLLLNRPNPDRVTAPLLVLGAECDRAVTPKEVRATGRAYRTKAEIFGDMGHDMMLEPGWPAVAERIDSWLSARGL
jgi:pimeloyl-ACP methyl ester carboxylesterase